MSWTDYLQMTAIIVLSMAVGSAAGYGLYCLLEYFIG